MIWKLRKRFIIAAMACISAVVVVILFALNALNYFQVISDGDETLTMLLEGRDWQEDREPDPPEYVVPTSPNLDGEKMPDGNAKMQGPHFEPRYFTILLDFYGNLIETDMSHVSYIAEDEAVQMAMDMLNDDRDWGTKYSYLFACKETDDGIFYVFLDYSGPFYMVYTTYLTSLAVAVISLLAIFGLTWAVSGAVVKPLAETYEKQKRFITDASHEIKTPLTIIDANTEVLELESGENEWTHSIRKQVARMADMTHRLVNMARMEEGESAFRKEKFDFSQMTLETIEPFLVVAEAKEKTLVYDVTPDIMYFGDAKMLRELISILLDNAMKYSTAGATIRFSVKKQGRSLLVECRNPADNIKKGKLNMFFERFYRSDQAHSSLQPGSGIGLSLAKAVTEGHKGKMNAYSPDGVEFVITAIL